MANRVSQQSLAAAPPLPIALPRLESRPLVSVLLINFNYAAYLGEAIDSVLAQTYDGWELIICDDGSSDNSYDIARAYAKRDRRIYAFRQENCGQAAATNAAYCLSRGSIISFLDADDCFRKEKLAKVIARFAMRPSAGLLVHSVLVVNRWGNPIQRAPFWDRFEEGYICDRLLARGGRWCNTSSSGISLRREVSELIFPIPKLRDQDAFVYTLAPLLTEVTCIDDCLCTYRVHGVNLNGGNQITLEGKAAVVEGIRQTLEEVNRRLELLRLNFRLDLEMNIGYLQGMINLLLLQPLPRVRILAQYADWVPRLLRDSYYTPLQKLITLATYTIGVLLPLRLRKALLGQLYTPTRLKERILSMLWRCRVETGTQ
jgi:glycosyltransferase involved in cell wall biosynthesis